MNLPRPQGLMGEWIEFYSEKLMAPLEFTTSAAIGVMSGVVGKSVKFYLGGKRYPTIWSLVLAPAGGRKSTAYGPVDRMMEQVRGDIVLSNRATPEGWLEEVGRKVDGYWSVGEIGGFLGMLTRGYSHGFSQDLCDAWDNRSVLHRRADGKERRVHEPAITALATGRATDFLEQTGAELFSSGFMSRFLIFSTDTKPAYRGLRIQPNGGDAMEVEFADRLRRIARGNRGVPRMAEYSDEFVERWEADDAQWQDEVVPKSLEGFASRRGNQALRLAILHAISRTGEPVCDAVDASWGCLTAQACYEAVRGLIGDSEIGLSEAERRRERVFQYVRTTAMNDSTLCSIRDLNRDMRRHLSSASELNGMIELWVNGGLVERGMLGRKHVLRVLGIDREPPAEYRGRS